MKRRSWLVVALVAVLSAAFCVQATSTWKFGQQQHLADLALPALVILLEVGSITSAAIFFSARGVGLRVRALLMLVITAGLGGAAGVMAYGVAIGVVVAVLMVGLVEVVGAYRHEKAEPESESTSRSQDNQDNQDNQWSGPETVDLPAPVEPEPEPALEPQRPQLESVGWSVDQIVADLHERGEQDINQRGIRNRYKVGPGKANKVLDALRPQEAAS